MQCHQVVLVVELVKVKPALFPHSGRKTMSQTLNQNHGFNGFMDDLHEDAGRGR
jgi:hypothetical protein